MFRRYAFWAAVALLAAGALFGSISSGSAASPAVTFGLECPPGFVTPGDEWGCHGTVTNDGPQTATHMTLVLDVDATMLADSSFVADECTDLVDGAMSCELGNFAADEILEFDLVFDGLPSTGTAAISAKVLFDERVADGPDTGKQDTVCANGGALPDCTASATTSLVAATEQNDKAGGRVAFLDNQPDVLATSGTPAAVGEIITSLTIPFRADFPFGFAATIVDTGPPHALCPAGVTCFGQAVTENLEGEFDDDDPVVATFQLIAPKGKTEKNIGIYHNGDLVESCLDTPLSEVDDVDECVFSRSKDGKTKVVTIVVHTTDNGLWVVD